MYPDREALVGYLDERYVILDPESGAMDMREALPGALSSGGGDIVSVAEGATYAAVADLSVTDEAGAAAYTLLRIDPTTGAVLDNLGPFTAFTHDGMFALAYWEGVLYAFSGNSRLVTVDEATKKMELVSVHGMTDGMWGHGTVLWGATSSVCSPLPHAP